LKLYTDFAAQAVAPTQIANKTKPVQKHFRLFTYALLLVNIFAAPD